jgi:hypothetical protein
MMITVSPSKTHQVEIQAPLQTMQPAFQGEAMRLYARISSWTKDEMMSRMKLSDTLADQVYELYQDQARKKSTAAITYYTGLVYKQLCLPQYSQNEWQYIKDNLRILSAMYGVLRPQDEVKPYRLDFLTKVPGENLYQSWGTLLESYWKDEVIVDLSSNEFGKLLPENRIRIQFLQKNAKGEWKSQSTKTKMARGKMLDWMIRKQIKTPEEIQAFGLNSYTFSPERSTDRIWVFCQK